MALSSEDSSEFGDLEVDQLDGDAEVDQKPALPISKKLESAEGSPKNILDYEDDGEITDDEAEPSKPDDSPIQDASAKDTAPKKTRSEDLEDGELEDDSDDDVPALPATGERLGGSNNGFSAERPRIEYPRTGGGSGGNYSSHHTVRTHSHNGGHNNNGDRSANGGRRRPEDFGICKFYLRGSCTWNDRCKYSHPLGDEKIEWLREIGLYPDRHRDRERRTSATRTSPEGRPERHRAVVRTVWRSGSATNHSRKTSPTEGSRKTSPRDSTDDAAGTTSRKSPEPLPVSSPENSPVRVDISPPSRSPTLRSPRAVSISSDEEPDDHRSPRHSSRSRSGSRSPRSSRSRSVSPIPRRSKDSGATTTLGALLRKRRLESQASEPAKEGSKRARNSSPPPSATALQRQEREDELRLLFEKDPDDVPTAYKLDDEDDGSGVSISSESMSSPLLTSLD